MTVKQRKLCFLCRFWRFYQRIRFRRTDLV